MRRKSNLSAWLLGGILMASAIGAPASLTQALPSAPQSLSQGANAGQHVGRVPGALAATALGDRQPAHATDAISVSREDSHWVLQARGMPRGQLARQLATQSGTVLNASLTAMDRAAPAVVMLRTRSLSDAWRAVLGDEFSHAVMCDAGRCKVWVTGLLPRGTAQAPAQQSKGPVGPSTSPMAQPVITSDPPGLFPSD